jgi:hypothetical protein
MRMLRGCNARAENEFLMTRSHGTAKHGSTSMNPIERALVTFAVAGILILLALLLAFAFVAPTGKQRSLSVHTYPKVLPREDSAADAPRRLSNSERLLENEIAAVTRTAAPSNRDLCGGGGQVN